jgi:prolyl oligopeptidase
MLYGYGGFNISLTQSFSISNAVWMKWGVLCLIYEVVANTEKRWHDAGTKMQKQNVFDDFIAAAEYLIAQNIPLISLLFAVAQMEVCFVGRR